MEPRPNGVVTFFAANRSQLPVVEVRLVDARCSRLPDRQTWEVDPDAQAPKPTGVVVAGVAYTCSVRFLVDGIPQPAWDDRTIYSATFHITDATGLRWERTDNQPPRRILHRR